jgi:two-component system LytT family response regulator
MRILVVDDEPLARSGIQARLAQYPDVQVVGECETGQAAVMAIRDLVPDVVFLDIRMPDLDGFEVLRQLSPGKLPFVIFLTAYDRYAVDAFTVHAVDYLLKPIDDARLVRSLERARMRMNAATSKDMELRLRSLLKQVTVNPAPPAYEVQFAVPTGRRIAIVATVDIDWVEASGDYVTFHVGQRSHLLRKTMNRLEEQLDPRRFIRIHRSVIVQVSRICELETLPNHEYLLRLTNGTRLRTSRRFSDRIEHWLAGESERNFGR